MTAMRILASASWTADDGPLTAGRTGSPSRFIRMVEHVMCAVGVQPGEPTTWIVGTRHGPWASALHAARRPTSGVELATASHALQELSHALDHRGSISIVSAGVRSTAMALVEAAARIGCSRTIVVLAEESTPADAHAPVHDGLAVAFALEKGEAHGPRLGMPTRRGETPCSAMRAAFAVNPMWPALALAEALRRGTWGWHALELPSGALDPVWSVELTHPS